MSIKAKQTTLKSVNVVADHTSAPCCFLNIIMINLVEINARNVGLILFPWPLPWCGMGLFPYALSDLPKPVSIWCSVSCRTLNFALAVLPATPKLIRAKIAIECTMRS